MDPSGPDYGHAGSRNGVIWCRMALWRGPAATSSPRSPGFCTWALRMPALGPTLKRPFGGSKRRPGRFWRSPKGRCSWGSQRTPQDHPGGAPGVELLPKYEFSGGPQCAKISPCRAPKRSYMVSNGTLERSGGDAQPPVARVLHLEPSGHRLGPDLKCSI